MNIDDLTIGQAKELSNIFNLQASLKKSSGNLYSVYIGKYVICRSRNEGVNAGRVEDIDDTGVILTECRRLYYHKPASKDTSWYEGVAKSGISSDSKVGEFSTKIISEDYSLTSCSEISETSILSAKTNEQN